MTYVDTANFPRDPLVAGSAYDKINGFFGRMTQADGIDSLDSDFPPALAERSPIEDSLHSIQETISRNSMHLPAGFSLGLNRQFANLMDDDAWEDDDELIGPYALTAFILTLLHTQPKRRPSIGTNGRGSVTAAWINNGNRLVIECLSTGKVSLVLSRVTDSGEVERAATGPIRPNRIQQILVPYEPEVWFDS